MGASGAVIVVLVQILAAVLFIVIVVAIISTGVKKGINESSIGKAGDRPKPMTRRQAAKLKAAEALIAMNEPEPAPMSYADACAAAARDSASNRFKIVGVVRETGGDVTTYVEAATPENAKVKAELRGIVVTSIERF